MEAIMQNNPTKMAKQNMIQEKEYLKIGAFSFRNLTPKYRDEALEMLGREFGRQEPLTAGYTRKHPNNPSSPEYWSLFFSFFMDDAVTNHLSVGVFDTEADDKLIAVFICRDLTFVPQEFPRTFCEGKEVAQTFIILLEDELRKQLDKKVVDFLNQKGKTVDFWGVAIDKDYTGTKILFKNMLTLVEQFARDAGYTHGHIYAVNQKTNIVAKNANYEQISTINAKELVMRDQIPFSEADEFHKGPSLWLKKL